MTAIVPYIEVRGLTKVFELGQKRSAGPRRTMRAVDAVDLTLERGKVTALVGESGSGKSTVARLIACLLKPSEGAVLFEGENVLTRHRARELRAYRSHVQLVLQDPFGSLNPVRRVAQHLERPLRIHRVVPNASVPGRVDELLRSVGLDPPEKFVRRYPHELSGGQQQRVNIARALAVQPAILIADEPISMLDVSIRIGVLNLMLELKEQHHLGILYITHDIASARYCADEILVMYRGQIVERGPTADVLDNPLHPYTRLLLSAIPDARRRRRDGLAVPASSAATEPSSETNHGCRFIGRCPVAIPRCGEIEPELIDIRDSYAVRCHLHQALGGRSG